MSQKLNVQKAECPIKLNVRKAERPVAECPKAECPRAECLSVFAVDKPNLDFYIQPFTIGVHILFWDHVHMTFFGSHVVNMWS